MDLVIRLIGGSHLYKSTFGDRKLVHALSQLTEPRRFLVLTQGRVKLIGLLIALCQALVRLVIVRFQAQRLYVGRNGLERLFPQEERDVTNQLMRFRVVGIEL